MGSGLVKEPEVKQRPLLLLELDDFEKLKEFPCHSDPSIGTTLKNVTTLNLSTAFVVFISHAWYRDPKGTHSRPDNKSNDAFTLCKIGIRQLYSTQAAMLPRCFVWLDYSCVQHPDWADWVKHRQRISTSTSALQKQQHFDSSAILASTESRRPSSFFSGSNSLTYEHLKLDIIMRCCDCMFTPVTSPEAWKVLTVSLGHTLPNPVEGWNKTSSCYVNRAWCRLEMFFCANIPISKCTSSKGRQFTGNLATNLSAKRRPHFVFGPPHTDLLTSSELWHTQLLMPPQCLPCLQSSFFILLHPLRGTVSNNSDWKLIKHLCSFLLQHLSTHSPNGNGRRVSRSRSISLGASDKVSKSISGKRNFLGQVTDDDAEIVFSTGDHYQGGMYRGAMNGFGIYTYAEGDVYKGMFIKNEMSGVGTYTYADREQYSGSWLSGMKHGHGTMHYSNGDVYRGHWSGGVINGQGRYEYNSGDVYEGSRIDGVISGYGEMTCVNGDSYSGEYLEGRRHGNGVFKYAKGSVYEGMWVSNMMQGFGHFYSHEGWSYKGMWLSNKPHGEGIFKYKNGDVYRGEVEFGMKHGHGELLYRNGDCYTGSFVGDKREGSDGKLRVLPTSTRFGVGYTYKGCFKDDEFSGEGQQLYTNGDTFLGNFCLGWRAKGVFRKADGSVYDGDWHHDKRDGFGIYSYKSGSKYEGGWKEGMKHGAGTLTAHNGDFYRGYFHENKFHGYGVMTTKKGDVYKGRWECGVRQGKGQCIYKSGNHFSGIWKNNHRFRGTMRFWNGEVYEGEYDANGKQCQGRYTYSTGNDYAGEWKGKERSGLGTLKLVSKDTTITEKTAEWSRDFAYRIINVSTSYPVSTSTVKAPSDDTLDEGSECQSDTDCDIEDNVGGKSDGVDKE